MNIIYENISWVYKKLLCLLTGCFIICISIRAQDDTLMDTVLAPTTDPDTAIAIEQSDTNYQHSNYFERKADNVQPDTIQLRQVPGSVVDSLKRDDAFWYADYIFKKKEAKEKKIKIRDAKLPSQWMSMTTLVVIVVLFLGILIWYLFQNNIVSRRRAIAGKEKDEEISNENIFDINYQKEIDKAINDSDYRLAVRLMFLRLLKDLSLKNIIKYKQERTNFDYLSQLYSTGYYTDFFRLTRNYEYTWYGKFDVSRDAFDIIKNEFENFDRKLS